MVQWVLLSYTIEEKTTGVWWYSEYWEEKTTYSEYC